MSSTLTEERFVSDKLELPVKKCVDVNVALLEYVEEVEDVLEVVLVVVDDAETVADMVAEVVVDRSCVGVLIEWDTVFSLVAV